MFKLSLCVQQAGYSVNYGDDTAVIEVEGGLPRTYIRTKRTAHTVNVQFVLNKTKYQMLMAFWRVYQAEPNPFLIDLIIDNASLEEYEAIFVPNSFVLNSKEAGIFTVAAQLKVKQSRSALAVDEIIIITGGDTEFADELERLVNFHLPQAMENIE